MHYPMADDWRHAAQRFLDDRTAEDAKRDDRAHAMLDLLTQDALRRRGIMATVTRGTISARCGRDDAPFSMADFEEARAEALSEMAAKQGATMAAERAAAAKGEQGAT